MAPRVAVVAVVALLAALVAAETASAAVSSCSEVTSAVAPCLGYAMGSAASSPPEACCRGVRSLSTNVSSTADRQAVCTCLKSMTGVASMGNAANIPSECGVNVSVPISPNVDCSKIN